jgi:hypothetical protein
MARMIFSPLIITMCWLSLQSVGVRYGALWDPDFVDCAIPRHDFLFVSSGGGGVIDHKTQSQSDRVRVKKNVTSL